MIVNLRDITIENFEACIALEVNEEQKQFVAPNIYSIAQSKVYPETSIFGIYADDHIIGFAMFGRDNESDAREPWLIRFMVDQRYQKQGYGRQAMKLILEKMNALYVNENIYLSTKPHNINVIRFYEKFGFVSTGQIQYGELVFIKTMKVDNNHD